MFPLSIPCQYRPSCRSYLKVASKFTVGQPKMKDLLEALLAFPALSVQWAVHKLTRGILLLMVRFFSYLKQYADRAAVSLFLNGSRL